MKIKFTTEQKTGKKFDDARSISLGSINDIEYPEAMLAIYGEHEPYDTHMKHNRKLAEMFKLGNIKRSNLGLSADMLMNQCFNVDNYDVFISHSSNDINIAKDLQKIIANKGFTSFIDSNVWNNVYDIGDQLKEDRYNHSDVDIYLSVILTHSLTKVMDRARKVIFIASKESLTMNIDQLFNQTCSPWIFHELSMLKLLPSLAMKEAYNLSQENLKNMLNLQKQEKELNMTFNVKLPPFISSTSDKTVEEVLDRFLQ